MIVSDQSEWETITRDIKWVAAHDITSAKRVVSGDDRSYHFLDKLGRSILIVSTAELVTQSKFLLKCAESDTMYFTPIKLEAPTWHTFTNNIQAYCGAGEIVDAPTDELKMLLIALTTDPHNSHNYSKDQLPLPPEIKRTIYNEIYSGKTRCLIEDSLITLSLNTLQAYASSRRVVITRPMLTRRLKELGFSTYTTGKCRLWRGYLGDGDEG